MNSPIPSLLLPLWQNESLSETIGMKIYVTCTVICMKIKRFSWETFCTNTHSANGNSDGGSQSLHMCQAAHQASTDKNNLTEKQIYRLLLVCLQCPITKLYISRGSYRGISGTVHEPKIQRITVHG